jgi:hypothetical protein
VISRISLDYFEYFPLNSAVLREFYSAFEYFNCAGSRRPRSRETGPISAKLFELSEFLSDELPRTFSILLNIFFQYFYRKSALLDAYMGVLKVMRKSARARRFSFEDASRLKKELRSKHLAMNPDVAQESASSVGDGRSLCVLEIRSL